MENDKNHDIYCHWVELYTSTSTPNKPKSYCEAKSSDDASKWDLAMKEEIDTLAFSVMHPSSFVFALHDIGPYFSVTLNFCFVTYDNHPTSAPTALCLFPTFGPHFRVLLSRPHHHLIILNTPTTQFGSRSSHDHSCPFSSASRSLPGHVMP